MARTPASTAGGVKGEPAGRARLSQVGLEHRPVLVIGVHARPLLQGVLQLLDQRAHLIGGAQRTLHIPGHEHDASAAHERDVGADLAQSGRLRFGRTARGQLGQDAQESVAGHGLSGASDRLWSCRPLSPTPQAAISRLLKPQWGRRPTGSGSNAHPNSVNRGPSHCMNDPTRGGNRRCRVGARRQEHPVGQGGEAPNGVWVQPTPGLRQSRTGPLYKPSKVWQLVAG